MRNPIFLTLAAIRMVSAQTALPTEWIDPDTGHRVVRLSREPGTASLYFHQNAYSADGKKLVVTNPHGIATINLTTREIDQVVEGRVNILVTGHKTGQIYYTKEGAIWATDPDTHATREVAKIPVQAGRGGAFAVNADASKPTGLRVRRRCSTPSTSRPARSARYTRRTTGPTTCRCPPPTPISSCSAMKDRGTLTTGFGPSGRMARACD